MDPRNTPSRREQRENLRARRRPRFTLLPRILSLLAMVGVGGLLVSSSIPASAFLTGNPMAQEIAADVGPVQKLGAESVEAIAVASDAPRDGYTVSSMVAQLRAKFGDRNYSYTNNPAGTIQWPFPVPVPIASGFGDRHVANCGFCSTFHQGVDFTPGAGVDIQAIADGVVSEVTYDGGLGNHVVIDHVIAGRKVQSVYGHMIAGSQRVVVGQAVKVTDLVGKVGSTGASTGAHLHLEIHLDGVPVDPYVWLKANAN
jgi:murein DD-endopeptidase MepM/ murein hydrolase activator NlpD